jgi:hypothetical protein
MRRDTPAAAYLFARTLYNARPFVENSKLNLHQKIGAIEKELYASEASTHADAGIPALALRFIRGMLEEVERAGFGGLNTAFGEIVKYGERYRNSANTTTGHLRVVTLAPSWKRGDMNAWPSS